MMIHLAETNSSDGNRTDVAADNRTVGAAEREQGENHGHRGQ